MNFFFSGAKLEGALVGAHVNVHHLPKSAVAVPAGNQTNTRDRVTPL